MSRGEGRRSFFRSRFVKVLLILLIISAGALWWLHDSQQPAEGTVVSDQQANTDVKGAETTRIQHIKGSIMEFDYPSVYDNTQSNPPTGNIAEQYSLGAHVAAAESRRISITVMKTDSGLVMTEDSAYKLRQQDAAHYKVETISISGREVEKTSKRDGSEVAYFIPGKTHYAMLVGSSSRVQGEFIADIAVAANSFQWLE